jgi:hypothetical protein
MKKLILFTLLMIGCLVVFSQKKNITPPSPKSKNILLGKKFEKFADSKNYTTLLFNNLNTGVSEGFSEFNGKEYKVTLEFKYSINNAKLTIIYDDSKEEYLIVKNATELVSTHLEGYVDGVWGKIKWKVQSSN